MSQVRVFGAARQAAAERARRLAEASGLESTDRPSLVAAVELGFDFACQRPAGLQNLKGLQSLNWARQHFVVSCTAPHAAHA